MSEIGGRSAIDANEVSLRRGGMSALSPFYPQLRTFAGAAGTAEKCQQRSLPPFAERQLWNVSGRALLWFDVCRPNDPRPLFGVAGQKRSKLSGGTRR